MCIFNKKRVNSTSEVKNMDKISVVVPCYNEEEALPVYYKEMCRVMDEMKDVVFELIFVDDGSSDATMDAYNACNPDAFLSELQAELDKRMKDAAKYE